MIDKEKLERLTESIVKSMVPIIKNHIQALLGNYFDMFSKKNERLDKIIEKIFKRQDKRLESVSIKDMRESFRDYALREAEIKAVYLKPINEVFNSTDEAISSFEEIKNKLEHIYSLKAWQIDLVDNLNIGSNDVFINALYDTEKPDAIMTLIVPNINKNLQVLKDFMDKNGYYLLRVVPRELEAPEMFNMKEGVLVYMCFSPKCPVNVAEEIRKSEYLYHVTPEYSIDSIREHGLIPQARTGDFLENSGISYPARIYFFHGSSEEQAISYSRQYMPSGTYYILSVKIEDLSDDYKMFYDPLLGKDAIYIEKEIPYNLISDENIFEI